MKKVFLVFLMVCFLASCQSHPGIPIEVKIVTVYNKDGVNGNPRTTIEYYDGSRGTVGGDYGSPGDVFVKWIPRHLYDNNPKRYGPVKRLKDE